MALVTIDFDDWQSNPGIITGLDRQRLTLLYAAFHVMEGILWEQAHEFEAFDDPNWKARNGLVTDALTKLAAQYIADFPEDCFQWEFRGFNEGEESHYTIQDGIEATLGRDGISMDSESGWFVVDCTDARKEALEAYLRENWKELDFSVEPADLDDLKPPQIGGWDKSERMLAQADVEATIALPDLTPKSPAEIRDILAEARKVLAQTRLPPADAARLLLASETNTV